MIDFTLLTFAGVFIGIIGTVLGGSMFFALPFFQWLFPSASFGVLVGNLKVGFLATAVVSSITNRKNINYLQNLKIIGFTLAGTFIGASIISDLSQVWAFPAVVIAVLITLFSPRYAHLISMRTFYVISFLIGIYGGFFGAGIGIIMIALLRLQYKEDTNIANIMIQSRFIEIALHVVAIGTHFYHGNLISSIWLPWMVGCAIGGLIGGLILKKMTHVSGKKQKYVLYFSFAVALTMSGYKAFF